MNIGQGTINPCVELSIRRLQTAGVGFVLFDLRQYACAGLIELKRWSVTAKGPLAGRSEKDCLGFA
jgi:hypothetical protein